MRIRPACLVFGVLLLVPALAYADSHNADFGGGASWGGGGSTLSGFIVTLGRSWKVPEGNPPADSPRRIVFGEVGVSSVQFGGDAGRDVTQVIWGGGLRVSYAQPRSRNFFHAQVQLVGVYTNDGRFISSKGNPEPNDKGVTVGGAYDWVFRKPIGGLTPVRGLGLRGQVDRVFNLGDRHSVWRFSGGLIYRVPRV